MYLVLLAIKKKYWYVEAKCGFGDHIQIAYFNYKNYITEKNDVNTWLLSTTAAEWLLKNKAI